MLVTEGRVNTGFADLADQRQAVGCGRAETQPFLDIVTFQVGEGLLHVVTDRFQRPARDIFVNAAQFHRAGAAQAGFHRIHAELALGHHHRVAWHL